MRASHRVIDSRGKMIGYIVDDVFYTESYIRDNIQYINNIRMTSEGKLEEENNNAFTSFRFVIFVTQEYTHSLYSSKFFI